MNDHSVELNGHRLPHFPDIAEIGGCTSLSLDDNDIGAIGALPDSLRYLSIERNRLVAVSDLRVPLVSLAASWNQIASVVPPSLHCGALLELELAHNSITAEHLAAIAGFANLRLLDLSFNSIEGSFAPLRPLECLQELNLANNSISTIDGMQGLTALEHCNLSNNEILGCYFSVPSIYAGALAALKTMDLSHNCVPSADAFTRAARLFPNLEVGARAAHTLRTPRASVGTAAVNHLRGHSYPRYSCTLALLHSAAQLCACTPHSVAAR
jgi:Leucine-rich repeat (LRR) protein